MLVTALVVVSCSDDIEQEPQDIDFCVRAAWHNGRTGGTTRALSATDILQAGKEDIVIATDDYPATIDVKCSDNTVFTLTKGADFCDDHSEYWQYTPSVIYKDRNIEHANLSFTFSATIDNGDVLTGTANKNNISAKTASSQRHMQITLHHTKALLRFAFKVSEKYDRIRYIRVTGITLNGTNCTLIDKVLKTEGQLIAYAYIDPEVVTVTHENTLRCTYNVYDKDDATEDHLTREGVTTTNTFTLNKVFSGSPAEKVTTITPGYYYDLNITIDPDYLYTLSNHDDKSGIKIQ